jgi:putative membrane protein insertion efficiency factor
MMARLLIFLVCVYRGSLGPLLGGRCRFQPTCSQYMIDAIRKYGAWRGTGRGLRRLARCHPFGGGGYDPA